MYIELYLLDNSVMNLLILRMACAARGLRAPAWRLLAGALAGASYALLAWKWGRPPRCP